MEIITKRNTVNDRKDLLRNIYHNEDENYLCNSVWLLSKVRRESRVCYWWPGDPGGSLH